MFGLPLLLLCLAAAGDAPQTRVTVGVFLRNADAINLERPWSLFLLTLAPPLLLVLLCCWLVFFLRAQHVDARVGTVITALLTIVFLDLARQLELRIHRLDRLAVRAFPPVYLVGCALLILLRR